MKKYHVIISMLFIITMLSSLHVFAEERVKSLHIELIHPQKSNAPRRVSNVSTEPVIVSGTVPVTISKKPNPQDIQDIAEERYLVEYFIDDVLVYKTNGMIEGMDTPSFNWTLDTTKYKNGKHKIVVNYWDDKSPSAIGVKYFIIENPISIEDLLNE